MFGHDTFFPQPLDTDSQAIAKMVRLNSALLGVNGTVSVADTSAHIPTLGQSAFAAITATAATVIATLEQVNPDGTFSQSTAVSLAAGQTIYGFFTLVTLTSGSVVLYPISRLGKLENCVPLLTGSWDTTNQKAVVNVALGAGGAPPGSIQISRKVNAGSYAVVGGLAANTVDGTATINDTTARAGSDVVKFKAQYAESYSSGSNRGRVGSFSNEITITTTAIDAALSALVLTGAGASLSPSFAAGTFSYTSPITDATASVTVTPTVHEAHATIQVKIGAGSFATVASGAPSGALALVVGANTITVKVTAQDGTTTDTYTIVVTRVA